MSLPARPRVRSSKPKTRTGCKTCKIRRVKCDEGKPFCARCLKFGTICEGYDVNGRLNTSGLKKIIPQPSTCQAFLLPSIGKRPFTAVFQDNREYSYFLYFQEEAAPNISNNLDQSLFNHVIIQSSWVEPSLCQLVASVGALYKAESLNPLNLSKDSHRQYAFQQFGRALQSVQVRISTNRYRDTMRVALIASLLIYCFENLNGDVVSALRHLEGALQLMQKQLTSASRQYSHSKATSPTIELDGDLVAAFFRLDSGLLSRDDISNNESSGSRLGINYLEDIREVPERFNTIYEARNYLENIIFPTVPSLTNDMVHMYEQSSTRNINEKARHMYTTLSALLHQWSVAFAPLYAESLTASGKKNSIATATLRIRALSLELASQRVCARDLDSASLLNIMSREIVDLSKFVATDPSFLKSFVFDCGIVPGLSIVTAACIDMTIRKEALQVLKDIVPRREGAWDSLTAVKFGERCLGIGED